jgi:hypothetical protein
MTDPQYTELIDILRDIRLGMSLTVGVLWFMCLTVGLKYLWRD